METKDCLDHKLCQELEKHVEELTTSGKPCLDETLMKKLKRICKISDLYIKHCFHLLFTQLKKGHSEIRLSTFQIINELFNRSHAFRELLLLQFQEFLELAVGIEYNIPLPPPKAAADTLKTSALRGIQQWQDKYGAAYKKLALGVNFLKTCKKIDFDDIRAQDEAERLREQQRKEKIEKINNTRIDKVLKEMEENSDEMENILKEVNNCFDIILPRPDDFFINTENDSELSPEDAHVKRETVMASPDKSTNVSNLTGETSELPPMGEISESIVTNESEKHRDSCVKRKEENFNEVEQEVGHESESEEDEDAEEHWFVQDHGLGSRQYNIDIELSTNTVSLMETDDNRDVLLTLRDNYRLITNKFQPCVNKWLKILTKSGAKQELLTKTIDLKTKLENIVSKFHELKIIENLPASQNTNSKQDDSDDDFEDVPEKEGYEETVPTSAKVDYNIDGKSKRKSKSSSEWTMSMSRIIKKEDVQDPTTITANLAKVLGQDRLDKIECWDNPKPSTSTGKTHSDTSQSDKIDKKKQELLEKAPVVPYGIDLEYWENPDKIEAPSLVKENSDTLHRFWIPKDVENNKSSQSCIAAVTSRTFTYSGKFEPVKWKCRAPLQNGKLCERMDRVKCPFHGKIIARDESGKPSDSQDIKMEEQNESNVEEKPDWQDRELQADIEAALGIDLGSGLGKSKGKGKGKGKGKWKGRGKGKKNKYPNLTDISKVKNTSRTRIEKRVFNKSSVRRVAAAQNAADYKRVRDKFANQFNYAM